MQVRFLSLRPLMQPRSVTSPSKCRVMKGRTLMSRRRNAKTKRFFKKYLAKVARKAKLGSRRWSLSDIFS